MTQIKDQDGFRLATTRRTLPIALLRAREALMEQFRPLLLAHGVTEQQWRVMRVLHEAGELDASELATAACILAPSLSRMIKKLEANSYIRAVKDPKDGRRTLISLTEDGDAFIRNVAPQSAQIYAEIEAKVGPDRINTLLDEIESLIAAMSK